MAQIDFDANNYEPSTGFVPVPAGWYAAHITNSDKRDTKAKDGSWMLWFEFEIREGEHKGRNVFTRLNLGNQNQEAVRIAQAEFSALCRAAGKMRVTDTQQLHMLPLEIKVVERPETPQFAASNEIKGYRPAQNAAAPAPAPAGAPAGEPSWKRK
jgi:hypothetical protein